MTDTFKVLAQAALAATTLTDVYTCPASTQTILYAVICNRGGTATTFRVSVAANGAADATSQYLYYDQALGANESFIVPHKGSITIDASDVFRVYATSANVTVSVFGLELT